jgi:hypothetical protein
MSSFMVLAAVSESLRRVLWDSFRDNPVTRPIVGSDAAIVFTNPTETARDSANRLSLWLYQINENEFVKNEPPVRRNGHNQISATPLALNLYYLVTPFTPTGESDHLLLGAAMQALYENALMQVQRPADDIFEELQIIFCRLSLEELTRIWEALREPYRLSVCYQIRVTHIDSRRVIEKARVLSLDSDYWAVDDIREE